MFIPQQEPWDGMLELTKINQASKTLRLDRNDYVAIKRGLKTHTTSSGNKSSHTSTHLFIPQLAVEIVILDGPEWKQTIESFNGVPVNIDLKEFMRGM